MSVERATGSDWSACVCRRCGREFQWDDAKAITTDYEPLRSAFTVTIEVVCWRCEREHRAKQTPFPTWVEEAMSDPALIQSPEVHPSSGSATDSSSSSSLREIPQ